MFVLSSDSANYNLLLPTDLSEITNEVLDEMLQDVTVAKHYCVIALVYAEKLFGLINGIRRNDAQPVQMKPIIGKIKEEDSLSTGFQTGDVTIIDRSSLERGVHLYTVKNALSPTKVYEYIEKDADLMKAILTGKIKEESGDDTCYFVEFKIVPLNDIVGVIRQTIGNVPFITYKDIN